MKLKLSKFFLHIIYLSNILFTISLSFVFDLLMIEVNILSLSFAEQTPRMGLLICQKQCVTIIEYEWPRWIRNETLNGTKRTNKDSIIGLSSVNYGIIYCAFERPMNEILRRVVWCPTNNKKNPKLSLWQRMVLNR